MRSLQILSDPDGYIDRVKTDARSKQKKVVLSFVSGLFWSCMSKSLGSVCAHSLTHTLTNSLTHSLTH